MSTYRVSSQSAKDQKKKQIAILWNFNSNFKSNFFKLKSVNKYKIYRL